MVQFFGIVLTMFSVMSMQLILVSVMPVISLELGGAQLYSWVFSGYMIASLVTIPLFSKLADVFGRRRFYLSSIAVFALGSVMGALSATMGQLIGARLIQGAAAGILTPVTIAMISEMYPAGQRGKMIGYFSMVQLLSNIVSPMLGEAITKYLNWHWVFYLSIVLLGAAFLIFLIAGKREEGRHGALRLKEIDLTGGLLFGALSALIVFFFNEFRLGEAVTVPFVLCLVAIAVIAVALALVEKRAQSPIIRTDFFRETILRRAIVSAMFSGAVMYGFVNMLPILAGVIRAHVTVSPSVVLLTFMLGITLGMVLGSRFCEKRPGLTFALWLGMAGAVLAVILCLRWNLYLLLLVVNFLSGAALGGIMSTVMISAQNHIKNEDRTLLSGIVQLGRYFGAAIGVALMISFIPNVNTVSSLGEFLAAFGVILGVCLLGIVNERL